ncbi:fibrinogen-like protein A [Corticium candelabrum]|uniref:fibrinogen-like protein A n=1 Tax=Corticium candelabrum TaxID=121492 RepID=UPI002E261359|nr:fibrinogen-like protein A [Corticium candelabrum]
MLKVKMDGLMKVLQFPRVHGIYEVDPRDGLGSLKVYCDIKTNGGGWTVFQWRRNGSEIFYCILLEYQQGFGELNGELWLGINAIHRLTVDVSLRNDMMSPDNSKAYAKYDEFSIANAKSKNFIYFGRYSETACDALKVYKGMKFSTHDQDNDTYSKNCAVEFRGAWWYVNCYDSNLNGEYTCGRSGQHLDVWEHFQGTKPLQKVEMKLK